MNTLKKIIALILTLTILSLSFVSCIDKGTDGGENDATTTDPAYAKPTAPGENSRVINVIFALATVPPVLAAIDCIDNGYDTYAIIERGKTYSGIEQISSFHNAGFDVSSNESSGFSKEEFDAMVAKVRELNDASDDVFFNFFAQDGTALYCTAIAANAGVSADSFHVYMCEDGTGAYVALGNNYVNGKIADGEKDEPYAALADAVAEAKTMFDTMMSEKNVTYGSSMLKYNIARAFALATLPNFTYYMQDETIVNRIISGAGKDSALLDAFGIEGGNKRAEYRLNLKYQKISEGVARLSEEKRESYLKLMYGDFYEDTYTSLTRTERAGEKAPASKLVFIGARHSYYPQFASSEDHGIGGLTMDDSLPESYAELDAKYKIPLLFPTEADYKLFLDIVKDSSNYTSDANDVIIDVVGTACFNLYIDYIYTLKFTYALYGEDYDIIIKGHPREVLGSSEEWGKRYNIAYAEGQNYTFDSVLDKLLLAFHSSDSTGKYIGTVPYGTAAENLAYLGADVSICGLPSSTYSGYDTDVDVLFIMALTNESIAGDTSQVRERYNAGNLTYTDGEEEKLCKYYNTGNVYKYVSEILKGKNDEMSSKFGALYTDWTTAVHSGSEINDQGFALK